MNVISEKTRFLLALSMLRGVGPAALRKVVAIEGFEAKTIEEIGALLPPIAKACSNVEAWQSASVAAETQIDEAERHRGSIISICDPFYPPLLAEVKDDPVILFTLGHLFSHSERSVAIIGTREPTAHGELIACRISQFFVENEWSIVSGLAIGCDAIAHQAALEAGGHTVAVLAHGLHMVAPSRHKKLAANILEAGGALVSEYPYGQGVQNQQYVKRDRIQAGMAQGVVMIQSDLKGGSLHASRAALEYDRWLAAPYPTERDREKHEPKIHANLILANGTSRERLELLRCKDDALDRVLIIFGRNDYAVLLEPEPHKVLSKNPNSSNLPVDSESKESPAESQLDLLGKDSSEGCAKALKGGERLGSGSREALARQYAGFCGYDSARLESAFARLLGDIGYVGENVFSSDYFRSGQPSDLAEVVEALGKLIAARADRIHWAPSEKTTSEAPYRSIKAAGEMLEQIGRHMRGVTASERLDYHWLIMGALVNVISGLLEKIETSNV